MKKLFVLAVLTPVLMFSLTGCGGDEIIEAPGKRATEETKGLVSQMNEHTEKYNEAFG